MRIHPDRIFRFAVFIVALSLFLGWMCCTLPACCAETYELSLSYATANGGKVEGHGSAVCVAAVKDRSILVTAAHNVAEYPKGVWIAVDRDWYQAENVKVDPDNDVASLEVPFRLNPTQLADDVPPVGAELTVTGYGEMIHKASNPVFKFKAVIIKEVATFDKGDPVPLMQGVNGEHVITGDSGGGIYYRTEDGEDVCVGLASFHEEKFEAHTRMQHSSKRFKSGFVSSRTVHRFLSTQYGSPCPGGVCPIQVRPRVRQPMVGIGLPVGPPQVYHEAVPVPQTYVPQPEPRVVQGPPGRDGEPGPRGEPGMGVTQQQVEAVVNAWLDSNADRLRGEPGRDGSPGERGLVGVPDNEDISNWLNGALSDPNTRDMLRSQLRDLLAEDPRIQELLRRINSGEASRSVDLELVGNGSTTLGRSRITIGKSDVTVESKTADGKSAGSRSYSLKQPIRLNLSGASR